MSFDTHALFGFYHLLFFVITVGAAVSLAIVFRKTQNEKLILYICLGLTIMCQLIFIFNYAQGYPANNPDKNGDVINWLIPPDELPLHLCNVQLFVMLGITFITNEKIRMGLIAFFIPTAIAGAFLAMALATSPVDFGWISFVGAQYCISHGVLIFLGLYLYFYHYKKLTIKLVIISLCSLLFSGIVSIYVNSAIRGDANYFFTARPPHEGLPLLNLENGWPVYIFSLFGIAILLIPLIYLPVIIREVKKIVHAKKCANNNLENNDSETKE